MIRLIRDFLKSKVSLFIHVNLTVRYCVEKIILETILLISHLEKTYQILIYIFLKTTYKNNFIDFYLGKPSKLDSLEIIQTFDSLPTSTH